MNEVDYIWSEFSSLAIISGKMKGDEALPRLINNDTYYTTIEICREAGISRSTLLRWLRNGELNSTPRRDRRGWRVFSDIEVKRIKEEANRLR